MIPSNVVSNAIYFVDKGTVRVYYKDTQYGLINLDEGSYFGEISLIFQVLNHYKYIPLITTNKNKPEEKVTKIFSIHEKHL